MFGLCQVDARFPTSVELEQQGLVLKEAAAERVRGLGHVGDFRSGGGRPRLTTVHCLSLRSMVPARATMSWVVVVSVAASSRTSSQARMRIDPGERHASDDAVGQ